MARITVPPACELGRQLEKEREALSLNRTAWYKLLKTDPPTYLGWLRGATPQPHNVETIALLLKVDEDTVNGWVREHRRAGGVDAHNPRYGRLLGPTTYRAASTLLAV